jgi:hypothetical protein
LDLPKTPGNTINTGPSITQALESLRAFHISISNLLGTADSLMLDSGASLHPKGVNNAITHQSAVLRRPQHWMPEFVFRWYAIDPPPKTPNQPEKAAYVSVILLPRDKTNDATQVRPFREPLVSCGIAHFHNGVPAQSTQLYHRARAILWTPKPAEGFWGFHWPSPVKHGPIVIESGAVPLTCVDTTDALKSLVIDPLLARIKATEGMDPMWTPPTG